MAVTEHSVTYGEPHLTHTVVTRKVFTNAGRILGTETRTTHTYHGSWEGWHLTGAPPVTKQFLHEDEASDWLDEMFREHQEWKVRQQGGTKLVILT